MRLYDGTLRAAGEDVEETFAEPDSATGSFPSQPPLAGPALSGRRGTKAMKSTVAAIILNWNDWPNTLVCLESVWRSDYDDFEVAVCDNGSTDGSLTRIGDWAAGRLEPVPDCGPSRTWAWPPVEKPVPCRGVVDVVGAPRKSGRKQLTLIANGANLGFAAGNNTGIRWALSRGCDYVWLLNNDTVVAPSALRSLVEAAAQQPRAAGLGSLLLEYSQPAVVQMAGGRVIPALGTSRKLGKQMTMRAAAVSPPWECEFVSGCSLLLTRRSLEEVGLLREEYFLYWEDGDWCRRARLRNFSVLCVPKSWVWHRESASAGLRSRRQYGFDMVSALTYLRHHHPRKLALATALKWMANVYSAFKHGASPAAALLGSFDGIRQFFLGKAGTRTPLVTRR